MKKLGWMFAVAVGILWLSQSVMAEGLSAQKEQEIIRNILSIYEPDSPLLAAGEQLEFQKCGTGIIAEAKWLWPQLTDETRALLKQYIGVRPVREFHYDTPDGHFRIHYDTTMNDTVYPHPVDMSHGVDDDGVPVYVKTCAEILHYVRQQEIEGLGYPAPPADDFYAEGETAAYDVYFTDFGERFYGWTVPDETTGGSLPGVPIATSYIELHNTFQFALYGPEGWDEIMSVTTAHEFFHSIQYGIEAGEACDGGTTCSDIWWHEMSATWMEDIVYDEINDYFHYLQGLFDYPDRSLTSNQGLHPYAACIWPIFLTERYGNDIMYDIWMQCGQKSELNSIEAMFDQIAARGSSFHEELGLFWLWCYYSGDRYRSFAFSEGMDYPTIDEAKYLNEHSQYPVDDSINIQIAPEYMGTAYLKFNKPALDSAVDFRVLIGHNNFELWGIVAAGMTDFEPTVASTRSITEPLIVPSWQNYDEIMVMVMPFNEDYSQYKNITKQKFYYAVDDTLQPIEGDAIHTVWPNPFSPDEAQDGLKIVVFRENKEETEVFVYNAAGELIRGGRGEILDGTSSYYIEDGTGETGKTFTWDGCNTAGERVASGVYLCVVRLGDRTSVQKVAVFRQ